MTSNSFTMLTWDEQIISGADGQPRFAHAHATFAYSGLIDGISVCDYLLYYPGAGFDGRGTTSPGLERIEGRVAGRKGSFLIRHEVGFNGHDVTGTWVVVEGSGSGELAGMTGNGTLSGASETMDYTFEYSI